MLKMTNDVTTTTNMSSEDVAGPSKNLKKRPLEDGNEEEGVREEPTNEPAAEVDAPLGEGALVEEEDEEVRHEKMINEEYKVWKKNAPFLYDLVVSHALEWPSLTVQWMPDLERPPNKDYFVQRLLLGTHTDGEQNYLQIATIQLPKDNYQDDVLAEGGDVSAAPTSHNEPAATIEMDNRRYDEALGEYGGYGGAQCRVQVVQRIPHDGEVNRARYMPQNCCIIASKTVSGEVHVFDYTKHASQPTVAIRAGETVPASPDLRLVGQTQEGYGLSWSPLRPGHLLSASLDMTVALWDVNAGSATNRVLQPVRIFRKHTAGLEDVHWSPSEETIFASGGDDSRLIFWDDRMGEAECAVASVDKAHDGDVNCVQFCPVDATTVATGGSDGVVKLWDRRNLAAGPKHLLKHHRGDVVSLSWSPHCCLDADELVLASSGSDRRVAIWDLGRVGAEIPLEDQEDGPPELLYVHGGHCNRVPDVAWNPHRPWMVASVAEDNVLQVWQPAGEVLFDFDDDDEDQGAEQRE